MSDLTWDIIDDYAFEAMETRLKDMVHDMPLKVSESKRAVGCSSVN